VGDFGLARVLDTSATQLQTGTFGTVTHMPLELIQQQLLTRATDVFSFGVLLWEMYNGKRAWAGKSAVQILYGRTARGLRLPIPADWPAGFRALVEDCLADDHSRRPAMEEVQARLAELAEDE
jgi:serine/threonine protein kinase